MTLSQQIYSHKVNTEKVDCLVLSPAQAVVLFPQYLLPILKIMYLFPMGKRYNILGPHNKLYTLPLQLRILAHDSLHF